MPTKICIVKAMVFPVNIHRCESWTIKRAECRRIDTFELWCWIRLLRVSWTARQSNQSILKEINPKYSLALMLKLKLQLQYFGHLMWRADSLEKTLMLGKIEGRKRRGWQENEMVGWYHQFNGHELGQTLGEGEGQGSLVWFSPWGWKESDATWWLHNRNITFPSGSLHKLLASSTRGQREDTRRTTIPQQLEQKLHYRKLIRMKKQSYVPDEEIRQNPRKTTKWSGDRQPSRKRI